MKARSSGLLFLLLLVVVGCDQHGSSTNHASSAASNPPHKTVSLLSDADIGLVTNFGGVKDGAVPPNFFGIGDTIVEGPGPIGETQAKAEKGDAEAQAELGSRYYHGSGVKQDYEVAVKWFRQSAEQGNLRGQAFLALCYEAG